MKKIKNSTDINKPLQPVLSKNIRLVIYFTLWFLHWNMAISSGIVSNAGAYMQMDKQFTEWEWGCFSPVYTFGKVVGGFSFAVLFNAVNRKYLLIAGCFVHAAMNFINIFSYNPYVVMSARTIAGAAHVFGTTYNSIWVGQYAFQKYKTLMKNFSSICSPLGRSSGYISEIYLGAWNVSYNF